MALLNSSGVHAATVSSPRTRASLAAAALLVAAAAATAQPTITNIGVLPGNGAFGSAAYAVSADGLVVTGTTNGSLGFRWSASTGMSSLGFLPGSTYTRTGAGVSAEGSVIVGTAHNATNTPRAFRWTATAGMRDLGALPGGTSSVGSATNADGSVVVGFGDTGGGLGAFRWTVASGMQNLGLLSGGISAFAAGVSGDGSVVVGNANTSTPGQGLAGRAFRWTSSTGMQSLGVLPGGTYSAANAISTDASTIAGFAIGPDGGRAFRWTASSGMQSLGLLAGASDANAYALSSDGSSIVGKSTDPLLGDRATLWTNSLGVVDLNAYLPSLGVNLAGWSLQEATGISADGHTIVGSGTLNGEVRAFIATNIPAPGAAVGLAMGGLLATRRRRATRGG